MTAQSQAIYFNKGQNDAKAGIPAKYESGYSWQAKAYLQGFQAAKAEAKIVKEDKRPTAKKSFGDSVLSLVGKVKPLPVSRRKREGKFAGKIMGYYIHTGKTNISKSVVFPSSDLVNALTL